MKNYSFTLETPLSYNCVRINYTINANSIQEALDKFDDIGNYTDFPILHCEVY